MEIEDIINLKVSYQNNVWSSITREENLGEIIKILKHEELKSKIFHLRKLLKNNQFEEYNFLKKGLPSVTFCGTFEKNRRIENLKDYNSIIVVDIDKLKSKEVKEVNECLKNDDYVFSHWISPSGNGVKGLIKLNKNFTLDNSKTESFHKLAFKEVTEYFLRKHSIELDISGSDISRLCFLSSDKNLYFKKIIKPFEINVNKKDLVFTKLNSPKKENSKINISNQTSFNNQKDKNDPRDKRTMINILKYLKKNKLSITDTYEKWYRVAFAISNTFTYDIGERFYLKLCRLDAEKYDERGSKRLLKYCFSKTRGDINFNTIVYLAIEKGFEIRG